jgi:diacylglycerol kinase (ATP)
MSSLRLLAIVNPQSGAMPRGGQQRALLSALIATVGDVRYTRARGDATRLAAEAESYDGLVAVGGDGTVAEVLTGMDRANQYLALVPTGTGNCLARQLGIRSVPAAIAAIQRGRMQRADLIEVRLRRADGDVSVHWLGSTAGFGYASDVAALAKRHFARLRGYAYAVAATFVAPRLREIRLRVDDAPETALRLTGVLANNTRHIGNACAFPEARLDDGLMDVFHFRSAWLRQCLHNFRMTTGLPVPGTPTAFRARTLHFRCDTPETVMLDGELVPGVCELKLTCRPAAVACIGGAQC